uniref:Uncharacterized protein n=1 Tax=Oryza glaberrima TaxID=4538 RepID=I1NN64_ORYGL
CPVLARVPPRLRRLGGLTNDDIGWFCVSYASKLLVAAPDVAKAVLVIADEFGVPRRMRPFKDVIVAAFLLKPEHLAWKAAFFRDEQSSGGRRRRVQAWRLWRGRDFINVATIVEEDFVAKFIRPSLVKDSNLDKVYESTIAEKELKNSKSV